MDFCIPKNKYPGIAFVVILYIISLQTKVLIYLVDLIVDNFNLTPMFIGLTIGSWGGNIGGNFF